MPFLAILLDALGVAGYYVQSQASQYYLAGTVFQGVLTAVLLVMTITYHGKRRGWFNFQTRVHNFTIRYAIIVMSLLVNAIVLFLYVMNVTGRNTMIFG